MRNFVIAFAFILATFVAAGQQNVKESFHNVTSLKVDGVFCNISIENSGNDLVDFSGKIVSNPENDQIKILYEQSGNELKVWVETPRNLHGTHQGELIFKVPRSTNVDANDISGNIYVKGIAGSRLVMKTVSGNIDLNNIDSDLKSETVSGNCTVGNVGGNLSVSSISGNLSVQGVKGSLKASTVSGRVDANSIEGKTQASSISGSVKIESVNNDTNGSSTSGSVYISGVIGDVKCNNTSGSIQLNRIKGSITAKTVSGPIKGTDITFSGESYFNSMSGSVEITATNSNEDLSFQLKSFSGRLNAKGIRGKEKLQIDRGPVIIHGETFSGEQSYL